MRAILNYHSIDGSGSPISIDETAFRRHVEWLASGRVSVLPLDQLVSPAGDDGDAVAITFDDGLLSVESIALPLLREHALPATVFIVTGAVGRSNAWPGRADARVPHLRLLDWDGVARLAEAGLTLGAHSHTHRPLSRLSTREVEDEVVTSRDRIADETGTQVTAFAYPFGDVDDRVEAIVARNFDLACGTELRALRSGDARHRLPRLDAYYLRDPRQLEAWGTPGFRLRLDVRRRARRIREQLARPA